MALDDKLELATLVLVEALKIGPNLEANLRDGSFASCAKIYRHLASASDCDERNPHLPRTRFSARPRTRPRNSVRSQSYAQYQYPLGIAIISKSQEHAGLGPAVPTLTNAVYASMIPTV